MLNKLHTSIREKRNIIITMFINQNINIIIIIFEITVIQLKYNDFSYTIVKPGIHSTKFLALF